MIRKTTALFFLLLANLVLLAHAVVPHHHHVSQICVNYTHCASDSETSDNNHDHDCGNGSANCILKQLVVLPSNQYKQECKILPVTDKHAEFDYVDAFLQNDDLKLIAPLIVSIFELHEITHNSSFDLSSPGLRAPPIV
jgi:hypothetical protein